MKCTNKNVKRNANRNARVKVKKRKPIKLLTKKGAAILFGVSLAVLIAAVALLIIINS
jgi:hypothetical protein